MAETLIKKGEWKRALDLHEKALAFRRERAALDVGLPFVRWDLTQSLNAVGDLFLRASPPRASEASALFEEANKVAEETLRVAPSFNELRKQLAKSQEGLARVALLGREKRNLEARRLLEQSLRTWRQVQSCASGDHENDDEPLRVQTPLGKPEQ